MKYDKEFSLSDIFTNEQYRARAILLVFVIIITILILLVRTAKPVENKLDDSTTINNNEIITNTNDNDSNSLYSRFSFIKLNNYEFTFSIDTNKEILITGKRFDNKLRMTVKSNSESYEYQIKNQKAKAMINGTLSDVNMPIVLFDYFDINVLYTIISNSQKVEDTTDKIEYQITNEKLSKLLSTQIINVLNEEDKGLNNSIIVYLNNNKIYHIYFDLNNITKCVDEIEKLTIDLKYENIGQVSDFVLDF